MAMIAHKKIWRLLILVSWALLLSISVNLAHAKTAHAATGLAGYSLTVSEDYSSYAYKTTSPKIVAWLTVPPGSTDIISTGNTLMGQYFYITIDGQEQEGSIGGVGTPGPYTYTIPSYTGDSSLSIGTHTVQGVFYSTSHETTITSDPITLTVTAEPKVTPTSLSCDLNSSVFYTASSSVTTMIALGVNTNVVTDYATATYTISFAGPQTYTEANLPQIDGGGRVTFTLPPTSGTYQYTLTYNGTALSNPYSTSGSIQVTAGNSLTFRLYSNPAKTAPGEIVTYDIAASWGAGLPTPTGTVLIDFQGSGLYSYYTNAVSLEANGTAQMQVTVPTDYVPASSNPLLVIYHGNFVYSPTNAGFSLTNLSNGGTGTTAPQVTPKTSASPSVTETTTSTANATTTSTATATVTDAATIDNTSGSSHQPGNMSGWVLGISLFLFICAGVFGFGIWSKRTQKRRQKMAATNIASAEAIEVHPPNIEDVPGEESANKATLIEEFTSEDTPVEEQTSANEYGVIQVEVVKMNEADTHPEMRIIGDTV